MYRRHDGSNNVLATTLPRWNIDAIGERILHISCVYLVHIRFALEVWSDKISIAIAIIIKLLIKIVSRDARYILQVVHRRYLWHLRGKW